MFTNESTKGKTAKNIEQPQWSQGCFGNTYIFDQLSDLLMRFKSLLETDFLIVDWSRLNKFKETLVASQGPPLDLKHV